MFSSRMKSCPTAWLSLVGILLVPVVACTAGGDDDAQGGDGQSSGGTGQSSGGAGAQAGAAAAGKGATNPEPLIACSCISGATAASEGGAGGASGGIVLCDDGLQALQTLCARMNAVNAYLSQTLGVCEDGTRLYHNMVYPAGADIPENETPLGTDQEAIESCVENYLNDDTIMKFEDNIDTGVCYTEAIWDCNGSWYSDNCGNNFVLEPNCSE
jgi:hypothetical protein